MVAAVRWSLIQTQPHGLVQLWHLWQCTLVGQPVKLHIVMINNKDHIHYFGMKPVIQHTVTCASWSLVITK